MNRIVLLGAGAFSHILRLALWQPHRTVRNPLLWMLPLAYAWIPVTFILRAFNAVGWAPMTAAVHALTVGAMTSLMVAMMMRSARGHTGRSLVAGPTEISSFIMLQVATVVRVGATFVPPERYQNLVVAAGLMWTLAFVALIAVYYRILTSPRVDGLPG